ncbi:type II toxin-antitoxin system VapC family toxin [Gracilinema caldarium]|uniref:PilT protein domain protein n=1 Tax=Gracilinema caldarium (strain ATCC 51460 / DSM 7334 / H1) TaxID=744872 RepID=F8EZB9_GRAC1|nr:type II toxin-antitoxin system VapC family toxin [Gracilinema caldarium]AEJ19711.1 PilT protein domain protein [Gracilinema caldarium DSM 7334]
MIIVLDASGAVEAALDREKGKQILDLLKVADITISPDIFISEATNVFWKYRKFSQFNDEICLKGIEFCINLIDDFVDSNNLWRESYFEGIKNQSSTYDMFYLVTARRNGAMLVTMDKKLNSIAKQYGIPIIEN